MYNTCGVGLCGLSALIQICGEERWDSWLGRPHCPFYTPVSSEASFPEVPNPQFSELLVVGSHFTCIILPQSVFPVYYAAACFPKVLTRVLEENKKGKRSP